MAKIESLYAKALFEISEEGNTLEKDLDDAIWIRDSLSDNEIQAFLLNPAFPMLKRPGYSVTLSQYD